jgi:hypothetical protein
MIAPCPRTLGAVANLSGFSSFESFGRLSGHDEMQRWGASTRNAAVTNRRDGQDCILTIWKLSATSSSA